MPCRAPVHISCEHTWCLSGLITLSRPFIANTNLSPVAYGVTSSLSPPGIKHSQPSQHCLLTSPPDSLNTQTLRQLDPGPCFFITTSTLKEAIANTNVCPVAYDVTFALSLWHKTLVVLAALSRHLAPQSANTQHPQLLDSAHSHASIDSVPAPKSPNHPHGSDRVLDLAYPRVSPYIPCVTTTWSFRTDQLITASTSHQHHEHRYRNHTYHNHGHRRARACARS